LGRGRAGVRKAIELKPGYASAHHWYAYYLAELGQLDHALREIDQAQELNPLSVYVITGAEDRSEGMALLNVDPRLDGLRSDPRSKSS
jgi:hypothetical protein